MRRMTMAVLLLVAIVAWSLDSRAAAPVPDQAHLLYTYLKNKDKTGPDKFRKKLLRMTRQYLEAYLATYPWKGDLSDLEAVQVVPYDMDEDEGDELFILFTGGPQVPGQPDYAVMLLDWSPDKWLFLPVFHDGWWQSGGPQSGDEGAVTRKIEYWGLRWMDGRPVAVGQRVADQVGPGTVKGHSEEIVLAWFDWKNSEMMESVPVRYTKSGATDCAEVAEEMKSYEAFVDVDWDNDVELVVYDVYKAEQSKKLSNARKCSTVPNKPAKKEHWLGIIIHDLEGGEFKQITGDKSRKLVLRLGELGWLDAEPFVAVLGIYENAEDAFAAKAALHDVDLSTTWLFRAGKFSTFIGNRIIVSSVPYFDKKMAKRACESFKEKAAACTVIKLGEQPSEEFYKKFEKK